MKFVRKNVLYIEEKDIDFLGNCPSWVTECFNKINGFIKIESQEAIDYYSKEELIDYDSIKKLSDEGIDEKIRSLTKSLTRYSNLWSNGSNKNKREIDEKIKRIQYMIKTLNGYKNNRDSYDEMIKNVMKSGSLKL